MRTSMTVVDATKVIRRLEGPIISRRALAVWVNEYQLLPNTEVQKHKHARLRLEHLIFIRLLLRIRRRGLPMQRLRHGLEYLQDEWPQLLETPGRITLVTDGEELWLRDLDDPEDLAQFIALVKQPGQATFAFAVHDLVESTRKAWEVWQEAPEMFGT